MAGLEQVRDTFDHGGIGLVLIGMPGIEKRLARYPQFYSRIGFVHEFRPLAAAEICRLLEQRWTPPGVQLPDHALDSETAAAIIRMTGGNFRLLNRLLTQDRTNSRNQRAAGSNQGGRRGCAGEPRHWAVLRRVAQTSAVLQQVGVYWSFQGLLCCEKGIALLFRLAIHLGNVDRLRPRLHR